MTIIYQNMQPLDSGRERGLDLDETLHCLPDHIVDQWRRQIREKALWSRLDLEQVGAGRG